MNISKRFPVGERGTLGMFLISLHLRPFCKGQYSDINKRSLLYYRRFPNRLDTELNDGDEVSIFPLISGRVISQNQRKRISKLEAMLDKSQNQTCFSLSGLIDCLYRLP